MIQWALRKGVLLERTYIHSRRLPLDHHGVVVAAERYDNVSIVLHAHAPRSAQEVLKFASNLDEEAQHTPFRPKAAAADATPKWSREQTLQNACAAFGFESNRERFHRVLRSCCCGKMHDIWRRHQCCCDTASCNLHHRSSGCSRGQVQSWRRTLLCAHSRRRTASCICDRQQGWHIHRGLAGMQLVNIHLFSTCSFPAIAQIILTCLL